MGGESPVPAATSARAVFLSYASEDTDAAQRVCATLRAAGIEVWFDQSELRGGDAWDIAIRKQIKSCSLFIPIVSANAHARIEGYFRLEWKLAVDRSHLIAPDQAFLLPVVIDATPQTDERIPDRFRDLQWTRAPDGIAPTGFVERVSRLLAPDQHGPRASTRSRTDAPAASDEATRLPGTSPASRSRLGLVLAAAAIVILAAFVVADRLIPARGAAETPATAASPSPAVPLPTPTTSAVSERSIAVLPFIDMSEKHDQEYFSDGLAEELLDLLAKIPDLQVIARTSSFSFKGKAEDVPSIARKLNVGNILEGSVRRSGTRIRITTQLIRASTGVHIWSETYDRDVADVFKVQDDIARAVVDKLKVTLLGPPPSALARTTNHEAHNLYLQGRFFVAQDSKTGTAKAVDYYQRAIALDPSYAQAWSALSFAYFRQMANGYVPTEQGLDESLAAARKAIAIDPSLSDGYAMLGALLMTREHDWAGARAQLEQALRLDPASTSAMFSMAHLTRVTGSMADALPQFQRLLDRDPLNLLQRRYYARVLYYAGHLDEAEATIREVLDASASFPAVHYELGRITLARGEVAAAVAEFEAEHSGWRAFGLPLAYHAAGRTAEEKVAMDALLKDPAGSEFQIAEAYAIIGDPDRAFTWLDRAILEHDPGIQWLRGDPLLKSLIRDARYPALLRRLKLPP